MVRNFKLTNDCPCQEPVICLRGVQKKYVFASMVNEVRLAFWESSPFASSVWFFTTSLQNHSQFLLLLCIFSITVNYGNLKKTMSLKFWCFFVHFFLKLPFAQKVNAYLPIKDGKDIKREKTVLWAVQTFNHWKQGWGNPQILWCSGGFLCWQESTLKSLIFYLIHYFCQQR